uniref:Uncharacterized protein n=1 Tax=Helianthus annuus TaxID=4232 RepID=A0A251UYG2_HELAN
MKIQTIHSNIIQVRTLCATRKVGPYPSFGALQTMSPRHETRTKGFPFIKIRTPLYHNQKFGPHVYSKGRTRL